MRYLLDTQILIWHLQGNPKLKPSLRAITENADNIMLVSQFTLLEISIKLKLEKLPEFIINIEDITNQFLSDGFTLLPITNHHIFSYQSVPFFENHRDPFDRFLLALPYQNKFLLFRLTKNLHFIIL